jgi:hypothetical protein
LLDHLLTPVSCNTTHAVRLTPSIVRQKGLQKLLS